MGENGFPCFNDWQHCVIRYLGFLVSPPVDAAIGYIVELSYGAILTMAYLTSLGKEFK